MSIAALIMASRQGMAYGNGPAQYRQSCPERVLGSMPWSEYHLNLRQSDLFQALFECEPV